MTKAVHGTVHGRAIKFDEDLGIPDGAQVEVIVTHSVPKQSWGQGIARSAGVANEIREFDQVFEQIERERKTATFRNSDRNSDRDSEA